MMQSLGTFETTNLYQHELPRSLAVSEDLQPKNGVEFMIPFTNGIESKNWIVKGKYSTTEVVTKNPQKPQYVFTFEASLVAPVDLQRDKRHLLVFALGFKDHDKMGTELVKCGWEPDNTSSGWLFSKQYANLKEQAIYNQADFV